MKGPVAISQTYIRLQTPPLNWNVDKALENKRTGKETSLPDFFSEIENIVLAVPYNESRGPARYSAIHVGIKEGSLKIYITYIGVILFGAYNGIAKYDDFKKGIKLIIEDGRATSDKIENLFQQLYTNNRPNMNIFQSRTALPGQILKIFDEHEKIEKNKNVWSTEKADEKILSMIERIQHVKSQLPDDEARQFEKILKDNGIYQRPPPGKILRSSVVLKDNIYTFEKIINLEKEK